MARGRELEGRGGADVPGADGVPLRTVVKRDGIKSEIGRAGLRARNEGQVEELKKKKQG
jgi:hypothetical protein